MMSGNPMRGSTLRPSPTLPPRAGRGRLPSAALWLGLSLCATAAGAQSAPPSATPPAANPTAAAPPAATASAQPQGSPTRQAELLFDEGVTLLDAKKFAAACAKFEESQRLDPAPGTLFNLATCEEGQGRFATAARRWRESIALLPAEDSRRAAAEKNATDTESKAGRLVLRLAPQAPPGTTATLDDRPLRAGDLAAAIVVDPGAHRIVVRAPGYEPRDITATTASGETREVALTPGPATQAPSATAGPTAPLPPTATVAATAMPAPPGLFSQHKASLATLGAGVALAAVGTGLAVEIISGHYHSFVQKCAPPPGCPQSEKDAMQGQAIAVNVLFAAAGAAGLAALGIFVFAEREPAARPRTQAVLAIGPTGMTLTVRR